MKFSAVFIAAAFAEEIVDDKWYGPKADTNGTAVATGPSVRSGSGRNLEEKERRYDDLTAIAQKLFRKAGLTGKNKFDERKYWTYGCHCLMLGDRPMSDMGHGKPVDALDNKCKAYKDCQKCVRETHGDECIGEFVRYTYRYATKRSQFESKDDAGSCERELFECDLQFAKDTLAQKDVFNEDYHLFWGTGFDSDENCITNGGMPVEHKCCGGHTAPYFWTNMVQNKCCDNVGGGQTIIDANDQC